MSQNIPAQMKCIEMSAPGGPQVLRAGTAPVPVPQAGEVLIKVAAAGVNRPDIQQRKGVYPPPPGASPILGLEAAGEIVACSAGVTQYRPGDKVTALCNGGGYGEYVAVPAGQCLPWPTGYSALQAAALPENYFTVWANLFDMAGLRADDALLVHGGTSGIGITAIHMARAHGAVVFATAGSDEKCDWLRRLGVTAINYRTQDFAAIIAEATGKGSVDIVLDMVGAPYTQRNLACLAPLGRLVQIAFMAGSTVKKLDLLPVMLKRLTITGSTMRPRSHAEKAAIATSLRQHVWPQLEAGTYAPVIHASFPLHQAAQAHELMESSTHIGKIMLSL